MDQKKMMGFDVPGDQKIPVPKRDWDAMKRAVWRMSQALAIVENAATDIVETCEHAEGCPGATDEQAPCLLKRRVENIEVAAKPSWFRRLVNRFRSSKPAVLVTLPGCRDREHRMSALVALNAARQFAPIDAHKPADEPFFAPSREYYSEILATLAAAQAELAAYREREGALPIDATPDEPISPAALPEASEVLPEANE